MHYTTSPVHESDEHCKLLHVSLFNKFATIITASRENNIMTPHLDSGFNLETVGPTLHCTDKLVLNVTLETPDGLRVQSQNGDMVAVQRNLKSILLETWTAVLKLDSSPPPSMAEFMRSATQAVRSLYTQTRLLPAYRLKITTPPVSIGSHLNQQPRLIMRVHEGEVAALDLEESLLGEGEFEPSSTLTLPPLRTPHGIITLTVHYRKNCKFDILPPPIGRGGSFEAVDLTPPTGRTPTNIISTGEKFKFGTSLGSTTSRGGSSQFTPVSLSESPQNQRDRDLRDPRDRDLRDPRDLRDLRRSSLSTSRPESLSQSRSIIKATSPLAPTQDSELAAFIASCEPIPIEGGITLNVKDLLERAERAKEAIREQLRAIESKSKLTVSPVLEEEHHDNIFGNIE